MVQNLREQKPVVLSSRIIMRWRENRDIWKTMGVPYSAKHHYMHQHLPQSSKALESRAEESGLPEPGSGTELEPATLGNVGRWMGCNIHHLHKPKKKSQGNQQVIN